MLHSQGKNFVKVNTLSLCKAFCYKPSFEPYSIFLIKYPLATHNFLINWFLNKLPSMILMEGLKLFFHGTISLWCFIIINFLMEGSGFFLINAFCHVECKSNKIPIPFRWFDLSSWPISS